MGEQYLNYVYALTLCFLETFLFLFKRKNNSSEIMGLFCIAEVNKLCMIYEAENQSFLAVFFLSFFLIDENPLQTSVTLFVGIHVYLWVESFVDVQFYTFFRIRNGETLTS